MCFLNKQKKKNQNLKEESQVVKKKKEKKKENKIELSYDPAFPRLDIYPEGGKKKTKT